MKVKYIGPYSEVDIPDARLVDIKRGEPFDISDVEGARLLQQPDNYEAVDKAAKDAIKAFSPDVAAMAYGLPVPDEQPAADAGEQSNEHNEES